MVCVFSLSTPTFGHSSDFFLFVWCVCISRSIINAYTQRNLNWNFIFGKCDAAQIWRIWLDLLDACYSNFGNQNVKRVWVLASQIGTFQHWRWSKFQTTNKNIKFVSWIVRIRWIVVAVFVFFFSSGSTLKCMCECVLIAIAHCVGLHKIKPQTKAQAEYENETHAK